MVEPVNEHLRSRLAALQQAVRGAATDGPGSGDASRVTARDLGARTAWVRAFGYPLVTPSSA